MFNTVTILGLNQVAAIKLLLYFFFIILGFGLFFTKRHPVWLVVLTSVVVGATYVVLIAGSKLTWFGLQGDEIFITAFFETYS